MLDEVVVRHDAGDKKEPLTTRSALQDPLNRPNAQSTCTTTKHGVKGVEEVFWVGRHGGQVS